MQGCILHCSGINKPHSPICPSALTRLVSTARTSLESGFIINSLNGSHCSKSPTEPATTNIPVYIIPDFIAGSKYSKVSFILGAIPASSWKKKVQGPPTPLVGSFSSARPKITDFKPTSRFLPPWLTSIFCSQLRTLSGLHGRYHAVCVFRKFLYSSKNLQVPFSFM